MNGGPSRPQLYHTPFRVNIEYRNNLVISVVDSKNLVVVLVAEASKSVILLIHLVVLEADRS